MNKTTEEKVLAAIATHTAKHRQNLATAKEFLATMKSRGLDLAAVIALLQKTEQV